MVIETMDTDESLMRRFQAGEREAFEALFDRYAAALINFACRFLHSRCEAEDVAQEIFLRVYKANDRYDALRPFRPWLYSIASRLVSDHVRAIKSHQEVAIDAECAAGGEGHSLLEVLADVAFREPHRALEKDDDVQKVRKALATLPKNQRVAVLLARFEDMSYEEITQTMNLSISAVKSLLFRAKQTLKQILVPNRPEETAVDAPIRLPVKQISEIAVAV